MSDDTLHPGLESWVVSANAPDTEAFERAS